MSDENVVSFRAAAPSARMKTFDKPDARALCDHRQVQVWRREPILECEKCGAVVDPYEWIRGRVQDWDRMQESLEYRREEVIRETKQLQAALRILKGEYKDEQERRMAERALMVLPGRMRVE